MKAALYLRISLDETGERLGVQRQEQACRAIADARGWTVSAVYTDNSISAFSKTARRPDYERMMADLAAKKFGALVVWDLDRLTRQPRQLEDLIDLAESRSFTLVTVDGNVDLSTENGRLFARMKAAVARSESELKAKRQRAANAQRRQQGKAPKGVALWGYDTDGAATDALPRATEMYKRFLAGESIASLARWLDVSNNTVRTRLTNPRYGGLMPYGRKETVGPGDWEPAVSEAEWKLTQTILASPDRRMQTGTARKYLLSGCATCALCGGRMAGQSRRYLCPRKCLSIVREPVEYEVLNAVRYYLLRDPESIRPERISVGADASDLDALRASERQNEADYADDVVDARAYSKKRDRLAAKIAAAEQQLIDQRISEVWTGHNALATFDSLPIDRQRRFLDHHLSITIRKPASRSRNFDRDNVVIVSRKTGQRLQVRSVLGQPK
ncbi:recombinase family protein [Mycobacterium sp. URHB0021]